MTNKFFSVNSNDIKHTCKHCNKTIAASNIRKHEKACSENPTNYKYCILCGKRIKSKYGKKFCSKTCSIIYRNTNHKHTEETKKKISISLGGSGKKSFCIICGVQISNGATVCPKHNESIKLAQNASALSFTRYEKVLVFELEKIYGPLKKEKVEGMYFDFCNDEYLIEFTFDWGRGTSQIIKRFESLKNDKRKRIAYVPETNVGETRRYKLHSVNVKIESSTQYEFLKKE